MSAVDLAAVAGALALDQAARLRSLVDTLAEPWPDEPQCPEHAAPAAKTAYSIAVVSGKGGVGKTTLAVNTSLDLASRGFETILFDADLGLANADLLLGVTPGLHLGHALEGGASIERLLTPVAERLALVAGGSGIASLADLSPSRRGELLSILRELEARCRVLLVDCGAGIGPGVLDLALAADEILVVTTPEPTALADAYGLVKSLVRRAHGGLLPRLSLVVNDCQNSDEAHDVHARAFGTCARFLGIELGFAGWVPSSAEVRRAVRARRPIVLASPRCDATRRVHALAAELATRFDQPSLNGARRQGLVVRLVRILGARSRERR